MPSFGKRLAHAVNTFFREEDDAPIASYAYGTSYSSRPDRPRSRAGVERTKINSIFTRMAVDTSGIKMEHVRIDMATGQYVETINSGLNQCLNIEANIDQAARHFRIDMPASMFKEGCIAVVPIETTADPRQTTSWDVLNMRVGTICQWYPQHVQVRVYNERTGQAEDITLPKRQVAIVENPFYSMMNETNSTLQRLTRKLAMLDNVDEISSSGKLDIIIQLPYVVKSESRQKQAEKRVQEIQNQLQGSTYGIAYTDGTEKITQLNRSIENNLLDQVKYLTEELYTELGITPEIMNGTADEEAMLNYINRTIEPVLDAITEAMTRTFLTKTARSQGQTIMYFQAPFKLLPIGKLSDIIDVLSRNQIVTPNEIRPTLGLRPSKQPQADQLVNSNMPLKDQITGEDGDQEFDFTEPADAEEAKLDSDMQKLGV